MKTKISLLFIIFLCFISCREDADTFDGPSIIEIAGDFKFLSDFSANKTTVDFANGETVDFSAQFNKPISWTLTIVGETTKATKIITGSSKSISASNGRWNGSTTNFPTFSAENCTATLTFKDLADTARISLKTLSPKKIDAFIIADFEAGLNSKWTTFVQSGTQIDFKVKTDNLAPEGKKYLNMAGAVNFDFLIGLIDFPAKAYGTAVTFPLAVNPESVYFNCLIYGVPDSTAANRSIVLFQFKEDENGNGVFNGVNEDLYAYEIRVDWEGWRLISVKYSDLTSLENGQPATPKGNGLRNPDKLGLISMLYLADPNNGFASTKIDLLSFSSNKPIEP